MIKGKELLGLIEVVRDSQDSARYFVNTIASWTFFWCLFGIQ